MNGCVAEGNEYLKRNRNEMKFDKIAKRNKTRDRISKTVYNVSRIGAVTMP